MQKNTVHTQMQFLGILPYDLCCSILVKMDDNIVRHYSNESTFLITLSPHASPSDTTTNYDVTLQDLE